jgi:hypothetical protein
VGRLLVSIWADAIRPYNAEDKAIDTHPRQKTLGFNLSGSKNLSTDA